MVGVKGFCEFSDQNEKIALFNINIHHCNCIFVENKSKHTMSSLIQQGPEFSTLETNRLLYCTRSFHL